MKISIIMPEYVELLPPELQDGKLYISKKYGTAVHRCCCGCGTKIVTPLKPTDWRLTEQDGLVTLFPSVGNWNHPCRSHYIIRSNRVLAAGDMTKREIARGRQWNDVAKQAYYRADGSSVDTQGKPVNSSTSTRRQESWLGKIKRWFDHLLG